VANDLPWLFPASRQRSGVLNLISSANWLKRVLKPVAERLGLDLDLRMFRRGFATIADSEGASLKDIQEQLRDASVTTTANVYVRPVPESVRAVVEKVDRALRVSSSKETDSVEPTEEISAVPELTTPVRHPDDFGDNAISDLDSWWARRDSNPGPPACEAERPCQGYEDKEDS